MKLKEINRTAIQSWSPAQHHPVYLAAGTSAQQLDASFSTSASLEIFELDLAEPSLDMKLRGAYSSSHRYHKLAWGPHGMDAQGLPSGVLIAGGENGDVILYDPAKIIAGHGDVVIAQSNKHSGPVRALDVNSFQDNLVASGGNESEIYIWDLNNFGSPMTPGPKTQPLEDISCVAWNRQVQHILASASPSGRASIWDLRKNDLIIKVSDHSNRMHCSGLEWNPEVATQLVLASEDDRMPVIQIWDLRFATSPLKVLENHTRGVLAIAWSLADPELLLSCGKDNRILCWNPNTAEVLYELPTSTQWCFDIQWCPRNPAVLSAAAFDGHISIYSIMGGSSQAFSQTQADTISTSFGNMDPFGMGQTLPPLQLSQAPPASTTITPLKKPPKWIRRPVGASFAFGGKLVSLENIKPNPQQPQQPTAHVVHISQVITETTFLERSAQLQATLAAGSFVDFCQEKMDSAQNEFEKTVWSFLKVNFENDARGKYLELLGYKKEELAPAAEVEVTGRLEPLAAEVDLTEALGAKPIAQEEMPVNEEIPLEEVPSSHPVSPSQRETNRCWFVPSGVDGLITQALLTGDFQGAVELCLHDNRMADSIILAIAGGAELLEKTQRKYFTKTHSKITKLISAVVMRDWRDVLQTCELQNWKEALAAVMTYAQPEEFSSLCDLLGCRLETVEDCTLQAQACLCYICAGNVEKLVTCWTRAQDRHCPLSLQDLVEKVVVLRKAVEQNQESDPSAVGLLLGEMMSQYASLLASQGSLTNAIAYLPQNTEQVAVQQLRDRLSRALGQQAPAAAPVPSMVSQQHAPAPVPAAAAATAPQQYYQPVRSASTVTSWSNQTPTALPSVPPPHLGPATTEALFQLVFNVTNACCSLSCEPPAYPPASQYNLGTGGPAIYSPLQYSAPPPPSFSSSSPQAPAPGFMPQYTQQPLYPPPSMGQPVSSAPPFSPPPLSSGASFQHGGPGSPASYMPPLPPTGSSGTQPDPASGRTDRCVCVCEWVSLCLSTGPQNGWNDPPTLSRVPKKKKVPENYTPPSPIMAPIFSPLGAGDPQQPPYMPPHQAPYQGMQQQMAPPPMNPGMLKTRGGSVEGAPGAPTGDTIQPLQSIPAEKITMKPIPDEHLVLKNTFEGLIHKCLAAATDPQTKRKLDDANKRLEALYDKLREQTLSPAIIGGLHNMVQCIESRSYVESLNIHTHIVSSSNFSETSAFMPVLKVVLTQANKLGV
uniref:Protein transport protein Sec31A n=1 Tax=Oncorhynchus kisutch TaxID=8019 RepID=A0A8C7M906_ONCKI